MHIRTLNIFFVNFIEFVSINDYEKRLQFMCQLRVSYIFFK